MKRTFILTMLTLAISFAAEAQDTLEFVNSVYYCPSAEYMMDSARNSTMFGLGTCHYFTPVTNGKRMTPNQDITIYGMAIAICHENVDMTYENNPGQVVLFDKDEHGIWRMSDSADFGDPYGKCYRNLHMIVDTRPRNSPVADMCDTVVPMHENYYHNPHTERDTFYYGFKSYDFEIDEEEIYAPEQEHYIRQYSIIKAIGLVLAHPDSTTRHYCWGYLKKGQFIEDDVYGLHWKNSSDGPYYCFFPILTPPPCYVPEVVGVDVVSNTSSRLTWKTTPYGTDFEVEYGPQGFVQGTGTVVSGIGDTSVILSGLEASVTYEAYLRAHCTRCEDQWSDYALIRFNTAGECGIAPTDMEKFVLLPNATHQQTTLHAPTMEEYHLEILNAAGQVILSQTLRGDLTLDVSSWPRGLYLFQIHGSRPDASTTRKLIVE